MPDLSDGLTEIWILMSKQAILARLARHAVAFCDWLSDPPMTERDRNKRYIAETRAARHRRYLVSR